MPLPLPRPAAPPPPGKGVCPPPPRPPPASIDTSSGAPTLPSSRLSFAASFPRMVVMVSEAASTNRVRGKRSPFPVCSAYDAPLVPPARQLLQLGRGVITSSPQVTCRPRTVHGMTRRPAVISLGCRAGLEKGGEIQSCLLQRRRQMRLWAWEIQEWRWYRYRCRVSDKRHTIQWLCASSRVAPRVHPKDLGTVEILLRSIKWCCMYGLRLYGYRIK